MEVLSIAVSGRNQPRFGVFSSDGGVFSFFDPETAAIVRRIEGLNGEVSHLELFSSS